MKYTLKMFLIIVVLLFSIECNAAINYERKEGMITNSYDYNKELKNYKVKVLRIEGGFKIISKINNLILKLDGDIDKISYLYSKANEIGYISDDSNIVYIMNYIKTKIILELEDYVIKEGYEVIEKISSLPENNNNAFNRDNYRIKNLYKLVSFVEEFFQENLYYPNLTKDFENLVLDFDPMWGQKNKNCDFGYYYEVGDTKSGIKNGAYKLSVCLEGNNNTAINDGGDSQKKFELGIFNFNVTKGFFLESIK